MKYAIQINSGPMEAQAVQTAYQFIKAALAEGHDIVRVFFYHDGVGQSICLSGNAGAEPPAASDWSRLAEEQGLDLVLCVSAAERRGIAVAEPAVGQGKPLLPGFRLGGLGQWIAACLKADRVLVFGA